MAFLARVDINSTLTNTHPSMISRHWICLPAGLRPPVFAGVASPPRPKAASPAKGLLPSLPICNNDDAIHRSEIGAAGKERAIITQGVRFKKGKGLRRRRHRKNNISIFFESVSATSRVTRSRIFEQELLAQGQAHREIIQILQHERKRTRETRS